MMTQGEADRALGVIDEIRIDVCKLMHILLPKEEAEQYPKQSSLDRWAVRYPLGAYATEEEKVEKALRVVNNDLRILVGNEVNNNNGSQRRIINELRKMSLMVEPIGMMDNIRTKQPVRPIDDNASADEIIQLLRNIQFRFEAQTYIGGKYKRCSVTFV